MRRKFVILKEVVVLVIITLFTTNLIATDLDSLKNSLDGASNDTVRMDLCYKISLEASRSSPVEAMEYAQRYHDFAYKLDVKSEKVSANNHIGILYYSLGDLSKTIDYFTRSSDLLNEKEDGRTKARLLNNLAIVYDELQQYDKAISYYKQSIIQKKEMGLDGLDLSSTYSNLGLAYVNTKQYDSAKYYLWLGYNLDFELADSTNIASSSENLGIYFADIENYDSATYYIENAKTIALTLEGEEYLLSDIYNRLGKIYMATEKYAKAKENYELALNLAKELEVSNILIESHLGLAETAKAKGDYKEAFEHYEAYTINKDSIFTEDAKRKLEGVETGFQVQQKEQEIQLLTQKGEIDELRLARNRLMLYFLIGTVILLVSIVILYYRKNKFKVKAMNMLQVQKNKIADKNKEIIDSIQYAKGIQEAMLPSANEFNRLFSNGFIFYQATDMVTGDFYWASETDNGVILAVVDCTGHGVPGALLTVLANSIITNLVKEKGITSPATILTELHYAVLKRLHQNNGDALHSNGMDAAVCFIPKNSTSVIYAGAKRPLYYVHEGELQIVKGNYYTVGASYYQEQITYNDHEVVMDKGDLIYLFTDGLVDQFGGDYGKKFLGKRLRKMLMDIHQDDTINQKSKIKSTIDNWMGEEPQVDDMLLVGVKI